MKIVFNELEKASGFLIIQLVIFVAGWYAIAWLINGWFFEGQDRVWFILALLATGAAVARLFNSVVAFLAWALKGKNYFAKKFLDYFEANDFPARVRETHDALDHLVIVQETGSKKARTAARELEIRIDEACDHNSILSWRMCSAMDAALNLYTPESSQPPDV
jgi:hypothetical protein